MMPVDHLPPSSVEHLHGPKQIPYGEDELVVLCLVRDGRPYVKSFIEHYFSLDVKHIVFMDNDSSDGTVSAACRYDNVTVLRTKLPFKDYELPMKQYLIARFGKSGRWCLYVDIDELFDYPYSDVVCLDSFLRYLTSKSYTAVMAHMLDMFPEKPLSGRAGDPDEPLKEVHRFYDLSNIKRRSLLAKPRLLLHYNTTYENHAMEMFRDGIRQTIFGPGHLLTKQPLLFLDGKVKAMDGSSRWVRNARVADLTCVLFHYKFLDGHFHALSARNVREGQYRHNSARYKKYLAGLEKGLSLQLKQDSARQIKGVNDLLQVQFLAISEDYVSWVNAEEKQNVLLQASPREGHGAAVSSLACRQQQRVRTLKMQQHAQQRTEMQRLVELQMAKRRAERRARKLEQQLENMQASWTWKLIKRLDHIKARVLLLAGGNLDARKRSHG
jgi:hypothetical protein